LLVSRVKENNQSIRSLGGEMGMMQDSFSKVLNPLVDNVKELGRLKESLSSIAEKKTKKTVKKK